MKNYRKELRQRKPLVHAITNVVSVNNCANIILSSGGSPIMADEAKEVEDIVSISDGLLINIGTINDRTFASMLKAGKAANNKGIPVVLDPVGVGASTYRKTCVETLLDQVSFALIKGNASEIACLMHASTSSRGVDANENDALHVQQHTQAIQALSTRLNTVIVVSGELDVVCFKDKVYEIHNGHSYMGSITGSGCMLGALLTSYIAAHPQDVLEACIQGVCAMSVSGELAVEKLKEGDYLGSFEHHFMNQIGIITDEQVREYANVQVR